MAVKITSTVLSLFGHGGDLRAVEGVRRLLTEVGIQDIELHPLEVEQASMLRRGATHRIREAELIEARGPMPEPEQVTGDA